MLVFPDFKNSILNVSSTFSEYLGRATEIPKISALEKELAKNYKNVVFVLVDGLGKNVLLQHRPNGFLAAHMTKTLTSVFPSTTACATTTVISAKYPIDHGWLGWSMFFEDEQRVAILFKNRDYYSMEDLDFDFSRKKLPLTVFFENIKRKDIETHSVFPDDIHLKAVKENVAEYSCRRGGGKGAFFSKLNALCKTENRKFVYAYYKEVDSVMHRVGPSGKAAAREIAALDRQFKKFAAQNPDTLIVVTADHGQIDVQGLVDIYADFDILECLKNKMSLDPRACVFHIKNGKEDDFKKAFKKYEKDFALFKTDDLIARGVFGTPTNTKNRGFLGDYIAIGGDTRKALLFRNQARYISPNRTYKGHHTGMSADEMLVPLIIIKGGAEK